MPVKNDREYRNLQKVLEIREASGDDDKKIVEGYATTFDSEYCLYADGDYEVWESVDARAFDECDMSDVIFQYNHAGRVFARNSNGTLNFRADEHGLFIEADLGGTSAGRALYEEIAGGYTNKMSFGFIVGEDAREVIEDHENRKTIVKRKITRISKLFDVSAVSIPANDATTISSRNYGEGVIAEIQEEFRKLQEINLAKEKMLLRLKLMEV